VGARLPSGPGLLDPYRLSAQAQFIVMVAAKAGERPFDHEIAERFRQAMERSGWRADSEEPDK
jgi:hypothetical protein